MTNLDQHTAVKLKAIPPEALRVLHTDSKKDEIVEAINKVFNLPFLPEGAEEDILNSIYDLVIPQLQRAEDLLNPTVKAMVIDWANDKVDIPRVPERWEGMILGYIYDWVVGAVISELKPYLNEYER